ncbi:HlyD family type I secretion periplasmic adaptor subunit [Alteriqipengyuania lutimaris]|uniref:Membrane fusion protein (MFP) family protein n=1 Tax=Alteriqipengyuania lutimaris TaxID=1538146 RepID=A0A395LN19_9SPHN|nr:HlyD family type I secretion periplasmic adaptor subunit [Alteriqipengyuania lutimaris]RDS78443.1 HlyD family type I secretion periplasmic adaptor subunit [Alteriqipengyuania lutimaris]
MGVLRSDPTLRRSGIACLVLFGLFIVFAGMAPLAEGTTAFGKVAGDSDRQVVQHLEGGIIDEILVEEGDSVEAGQPLMILRDVAATSGRERAAIDQAENAASIARLRALSAGAADPDLDRVDFSGVPAEAKAEIVQRHRDLFFQQRRKVDADVGVLETRRAGLAASVRNRQAEIDGNARQLAIVRADLADKRGLLREQLVTRSEVTGLEREEARLSAELGRLNTARAADTAEMADLSEQIAQARAQFSETVAADLVEEFARQSELEARRTSVEDVVERNVISAPMAGAVLNLRYRTAGGVVTPGEPILEIVPEGEGLVATVEIRPSDIEDIFRGQKVRARLAGIDSWRSPSIEGEVTRVSADLKTSADGSYSFYEARIRMDAGERAQIDAKIVPGMPVEAFLESGRKRTILDYFFEPLTSILRRGARS